MSYIIYNKKTGITLKDKYCINTRSFETQGAAKAYRTRLSNAGKIIKSHYHVIEASKFVDKKVMVRNMMSGKPVEQTVNTPRCCDVSSELYWSM